MGQGSTKSDRSKAIAKADKWFSLYIRARDGNSSVLSGQSDRKMNCGHVIRRGFLSTRWDEENAFCITAGENIAHEYNPEPFTQWIVSSFGKDYIPRLQRKAQTFKKYTVGDIEAIADFWKR